MCKNIPQSCQPRANLLLCDGHVVLHIPEHSGLDEVATVSSRPSTTQQLRPLLFPRFDIAKDLLKLSFIHLWEKEPRVTEMLRPRLSWLQA